MAQVSNTSYDIVYKVHYSFDDVELSKRVSIVEICDTFQSVIKYLHNIEEENKIVDNAFYRCRSNISISIKSDLISHKKFVSLFNSL